MAIRISGRYGGSSLIATRGFRLRTANWRLTTTQVIGSCSSSSSSLDSARMLAGADLDLRTLRLLVTSACCCPPGGDGACDAGVAMSLHVGMPPNPKMLAVTPKESVRH